MSNVKQSQQHRKLQQSSNPSVLSQLFNDQTFSKNETCSCCGKKLSSRNSVIYFGLRVCTQCKTQNPQLQTITKQDAKSKYNLVDKDLSHLRFHFDVNTRIIYLERDVAQLVSEKKRGAMNQPSSQKKLSSLLFRSQPQPFPKIKPLQSQPQQLSQQQQQFQQFQYQKQYQQQDIYYQSHDSISDSFTDSIADSFTDSISESFTDSIVTSDSLTSQDDFVDSNPSSSPYSSPSPSPSSPLRLTSLANERNRDISFDPMTSHPTEFMELDEEDQQQQQHRRQHHFITQQHQQLQPQEEEEMFDSSDFRRHELNMAAAISTPSVATTVTQLPQTSSLSPSKPIVTLSESSSQMSDEEKEKRRKERRERALRLLLQQNSVSITCNPLWCELMAMFEPYIEAEAHEQQELTSYFSDEGISWDEAKRRAEKVWRELIDKIVSQYGGGRENDDAVMSVGDRGEKFKCSDIRRSILEFVEAIIFENNGMSGEEIRQLIGRELLR